jgi:hypothetical protein
MSLQPGVYLTADNYSALVFAVHPDYVYFVANKPDVTTVLLAGSPRDVRTPGKLYDVHAMEPEAFARLYPQRLPDYPVRRCARIYSDSLFRKTPNAVRVINHLKRT